MTKDPINHLLREHVEIMAQVARLRTAVQEVTEKGQEALPETLPVFQQIGQMMATQLDLHRRKEDDVLFPAVEAVLGSGDSPTGVMRREHQEIHARGVLLRETLQELNEVQHPAIEAGGEQLRELAANGDNAEALRATSEEIIDLLDMHFEKEEQILFPLTREILEPDTLEQIMVDFERLAEQ